MQATAEDLTKLLSLQQTDLELIESKRTLKDLPQRSTILAARQKKSTIEQKRNQLTALFEQAQQKLSALEQEDASLVEKQRRVQHIMDKVQGDYRSVEAHAKEMGGFAKRRNTLERDLSKLGEELAKIKKVHDQVQSALAEIERQEHEAVLSFQKEGGQLQTLISRLEAQREQILTSLPVSLRQLYEQTAQRSKGVALGRLMEGRCGACRNIIDGGRLIELMSQAPLGVCPHCKRLLVVSE